MFVYLHIQMLRIYIKCLFTCYSFVSFLFMPIDEDLVSLGDEIDDNMISEDCSKHPKTDGSKKKPSRKIMGPKEILLDLLEKLKNKDKLGVFVGKVDKYSVPDYRKIIRIPMYFNKMERKINKGKYRGLESLND